MLRNVSGWIQIIQIECNSRLIAGSKMSQETQRTASSLTQACWVMPLTAISKGDGPASHLGMSGTAPKPDSCLPFRPQPTNATYSRKPFPTPKNALELPRHRNVPSPNNRLASLSSPSEYRGRLSTHSFFATVPTVPPFL